MTNGYPAAGFQHVIVEVSIDGVEYVRAGSPLAAQGTVPFRAEVGEDVTVRFWPVDTLGRVGSVSDISTITVKGIVGADVEYASITTNHIEAGSITAPLLDAGVGNALDLSSNISITALIDVTDSTQAQIDQVTLWFRVDDEGAHVGRSDSPFQAHMLPDQFNITDNGVVTTYWSSGRLFVPSLVTEEVVLSNHKFEQFGTGTVIRAIG